MKFFVMFLDHNGPVGVSAVWAEGSRWVRFYGEEMKDYPRAVFYDDRRSALNHAKAVTGWIKRNDGDLFNRTFSYKVLSIRDATEQSVHLTAGTVREKSGSKRKAATVKKAGSPSRK